MLHKVYKYSTLLLLFTTCGLLFTIVGKIDNDQMRYKIFDIFQLGVNKLFNLTDLKFSTNKDHTILFSYDHIAPLVNILSSVIWAGLFLILLQMFKKSPKKIESPSNFWKKVFFTNVTLSLLFFITWSCMSLDFIYDGIYTETSSLTKTIYNWFSFIAFIPATVPHLIASFTLDSGGDTPHGYGDMYLVAKTVTAFALTLWSFIGVFIYGTIQKLRRQQ